MKIADNDKKAKVFVGIDVHRLTYAVSEYVDGTIVKKSTMPGEPEELIKYLQKRYQIKELCTGYEAGFSGFVLHRKLEAAGIKNIVINASSIEVDSHSRVKTDKRDSVKIATQIAAGRLKSINIPTEEQELSRLVTRCRKQLVENKKSVMLQVRMRLLQYGCLPISYNKVLQLKDISVSVAKYHNKELLWTSLEPLLNIWISLKAEIKKLDLQIRKEVVLHSQVYQSIPGIGKLSARILATELGDLSQFSNDKKLACFVGLTPCEYSSGEHIRRGHISRQGSGWLRGILVQAAWKAITKDPELKSFYLKLAARRGGKRAIVAVARKLLLRSKALFRSGTIYEKNHNQEVEKKVA